MGLSKAARRAVPFGLGLVALLLTLFTAYAEPGAPPGQVRAKWKLPLPSATCSGSDRNCHLSSPALADVNGDGRLDIVLATNNGHVLAVAGDGRTLWDRDVSPSFGLGASRLGISSSPAVADLDGDGKVEVVVATGVISSSCQPGGVIVLDSQGRVKPGWPFLADDQMVAPTNCPDPIFSTPALGDLDNDGDLEIVAGGFDGHIYALQHTGALVPGFPPPSALYPRLGWSILSNRTADTIWGSPALADLNADGFLDIILGVDEGNFDAQTPGDAGGWSCPYRLPAGWAPGYCGGSLYALNGRGQLLPGFPRHILETIQSTPALVDLYLDDRPEIFVGTGTFYYDHSPDRPTYGFRFFGWDSAAADLGGWGGGKATSRGTPGSVSIGDIAGDSRPEILIASIDGRVYAWHHDGTAVSGFPMQPRNYMGNTDPFDVGETLLLADYDGDGKMEIFTTMGWTIAVIDGNGRMLTNTRFPSDQTTPFFYAEGLLRNNGAIGDVDGDGQLELVAHNSNLYVWDLPAGAVRADWPMLKRDAARASRSPTPGVAIQPKEMALAHVSGETAVFRTEVSIAVDQTRFQWELQTDSGRTIVFPTASGTAYERVRVPVEINVPADLRPGSHDLGDIHVVVNGVSQEIRERHGTIPVTVQIVDRVGELYIPAVRR